MEKVYFVNEDHWPIHVELTGNLDSSHVIVMLHGGGYDLHENGYYAVKDVHGFKRDDNGKRILYQKPYGNYDRFAVEVEAQNLDAAVLRIDIRNHGKSTLNGKLDLRESLFTRYAYDVEDVLQQVIQEYGYSSIYFVGTCLGSLITQYYLTMGLAYTSFVDGVVLVSPLSPYVLTTEDPNHGMNYKKVQMIKDGKIFDKMRFVREGMSTYQEALEHLAIHKQYAALGIDTLYLVSPQDRLIPFDLSLKVIDEMKENPHFRYSILEEDKIHGMADHCFYDPQSSDKLLSEEMSYFTAKIKKVSKKMY